MSRGSSRRRIEVRCPKCAGVVSVARDADPDDALHCGDCGADVTRDAKRAMMREVALGIASQLVERENRAFFEELGRRWDQGERR